MSRPYAKGNQGRAGRASPLHSGEWEQCGATPTDVLW
jgi:hypothetical protein